MSSSQEFQMNLGAFFKDNKRNFQKPNVYFDLDIPYSINFISRLFKINKRMALRYVDESGILTERGVIALQQLNEELGWSCDRYCIKNTS